MQVNVQFLQQLRPEWSRFETVVKEISHQSRIIQLALLACWLNHIHITTISTKPQRTNAPSYTAIYSNTTKIAKPVTPQSESVSEKDSDPEQARRDKDMQKNLALLAKYFKKLYKLQQPTFELFKLQNRTEDITQGINKRQSVSSLESKDDLLGRETVGSLVVQQNEIQCFNCKGFGHYARECRKPKRVKDYTYHKEKMMMYKQAEQGVPLQAEQADWLEDTDEEIDEQELEAHYSYMAKIQEVSPEESSSTSQPLEQVQNHDENDVFANVRRHSEQPESINDTYVLEKDDSNVIPDSSNICTNDNQENKTVLKQLKKANASLTQELKECKTNLDETSRALGEATSSRDSCLIALQTKQTELEKYTALNDRTSDYKILQTKLNETLGLVALKDIEIKEGLKTKACEISVVNQKHDELVKKSLLTRSQFEGQLKEKSKVISDLKVKEGKDIDTMIEMDKQIKFLNEILYKRNQSIQTIHMLAPKCATYNGRSTFANPKYLKIAQSEKPHLYEIPYDTSDPANRFCPNGEETVTLEKESRSKLDKDKVKPYDYTYQNSLYETFKPPSKTYLDQLERNSIDKESVSETIRWISYGPRATVVKYDAYNINGYTFRTKCHDGKVYQNSGIWVLDYPFRQIPIFKCDWVNHKSGGVKRDKLSKEIILQELDKMQAELVVTLCLLEKFFPLSFFDIMIHLTVHLTREVKLCGPIGFRWMYPFERCMKVIKGHVRNRNKPEGCIAEETIAEETIEFFSEYHKSIETIGIPPDKHETYENEEGKPLSAKKTSEVSAKLFQKAHLYVIHNTYEIVPYIERHKQVLKIENPGKRIAFLENEHSKSFAKWLHEEAKRELAIDKESVSETVRWISYGPRATVVKYDAYNINGYTFRTKCHDGKVYQNSGVSVEAIDLHISKEVATTRQAYYYGVLQEIWVLDYPFRQIPIFKCDWVNHKSGGVKRDKLRYTLVDLNKLGHKVDPFVLASQALQVFYVKDPVDKKLSIVFKTPPKNYKDTYDEVDEEFSIVIHHRNDNVLPLVDRCNLANESRDDYYRKDCGEIIDISSDSSDDRRWATKKASAPVFYGPSTQGLLDAYGYNTIEENVSWNYFSSTYNESTDMETTDKRNTDKDCIVDSNSAMSKGKYVPVCKKNKPNVYSHVQVTGSVLGLPNVTTWDEIEKKIGARKSKTCANKAKGKRKVSCGS
ncbi:retrovirus-related pol polyprotein from transposon TNT 1-94 [Tanacetum coccineum]